jgi:hypothetical protein
VPRPCEIYPALSDDLVSVPGSVRANVPAELQLQDGVLMMVSLSGRHTSLHVYELVFWRQLLYSGRHNNIVSVESFLCSRQ